jgi:hypothetical protein
MVMMIMMIIIIAALRRTCHFQQISHYSQTVDKSCKYFLKICNYKAHKLVKTREGEQISKNSNKNDNKYVRFIVQKNVSGTGFSLITLVFRYLYVSVSSSSSFTKILTAPLNKTQRMTTTIIG